MPTSLSGLCCLALLGFWAAVCSSLPSVSPSAMELNALVKRDTCNPECRSGYYVDNYDMPTCSWNCISYTNVAIRVQPAIIAGVAGIVAAFMMYAAQRNIVNHNQNVGRDIVNVTSAFDRVTQDLFGNPIAAGQWNGVSVHDPLAGTLIGTIGNLLIEIQEHEDNVSALITLTDHSLLDTRDENDLLTNAKVIYHNALVNGSPQERMFTDDERTRIGNSVAHAFESVCSHARALCDCLTSGQGDGFVGALTVEGQANNNGFFQQFNCDCDVGRDEL